jgi:4,5-DOPA dioxygenase extradiol
MSKTRFPALFVGHGSPMNALEDNAFTRGWQTAAAQMPKPRAIVCISAHWETQGTRIGAAEQPQTVHDFGGFPLALFAVRYPAPGDPALARHIAQSIKSANVNADLARGFDHGVWSVLRVMYPDADVPVLPLSVDRTLAPAAHYRLAQELAPLRDDGVLILGSGNIVHNLREFSFRDPAPLDWAVRAEARVRALIEAGDYRALTDASTLGPDVLRGIAGPEHFMPLLYVLAQAGPGEPVSFFNDTVIGSISMTCVKVG